MNPMLAPAETFSSGNSLQLGMMKSVTGSSQSLPGASPTKTSPKIAPTTTIMSKIFQIERKYEPGWSMTPRSMSFMTVSKIKKLVKIRSAYQSISARYENFQDFFVN